VFVHANIEKVVNGFKKSSDETLRFLNHSTLKGYQIPNHKDFAIHCTYDQILNLEYKDMATFDYIFIDEAHVLASSLDYRSDKILSLINHLVNFVGSRKTIKTKIIFMSGTPNVEFQVIPAILKQRNLYDLFQAIKVEKKYGTNPIIHLVHSDAEKKSERIDLVISQIKKYLDQGRKVCHIFNNKAKMDEYIREIQTKLGNDIKVGLYYSKSKGQCTENIMTGKFEDFDVVLATTYFFNGININSDGLSEKERSSGKTSTQKYGVVVDLGTLHSRISAIDCIQAVNRFRSRQCDCTVFLPKLFLTDSQNLNRKFNYGLAARNIFGINKYNYHLLSGNEKKTPVTMERDGDDRLRYLNEGRYFPSILTDEKITHLTKTEKDNREIQSFFDDLTPIYQDWLYSMEGYYSLTNQAKFTPILKYKWLADPYPTMTKEQIQLENTLVEQLLSNPELVEYLDGGYDPDKKIHVAATNVITDLTSTVIRNFTYVGFKNGYCKFIGDFHYSFERAINRVFQYNHTLKYWYGDTGLEIMRALINPKVNLLYNKHQSHVKNFGSYIKYCRGYSNPYNHEVIKYMRGLDYLSDKNIGISKRIFKDHIRYCFDYVPITDLVHSSWAEKQKEMITYNSENNRLTDEANNYYSNADAMKKTDLENLKKNLAKYFIYTPLKYNKNGKLISKETIIIPKVLHNDSLLADYKIDDLFKYHKVGFEERYYNESTDKSFAEPETCDQKMSDVALDRYCEDILDKIEIYESQVDNPIACMQELITIKELVVKKEIRKAMDLIVELKNKIKK
jgi:hypothetical protein